MRIEAWASTRSDCLEEVVAGLIANLTDTTSVPSEHTVLAEIAEETDEDALIGVLNEVIYLLDTESVFPLRAEVSETDAGLRVRMPVATADRLGLSTAPKAVTLNDLIFGFDGRTWTATVTVDV